ncbi:uncharacterized protein [Hyperolius riggenbachi]|uniref:uncharacterized protein n=2 Tax=Hyperolius riggenbachi TaxID=752182 RepID=UPI0035A382F5
MNRLDYRREVLRQLNDTDVYIKLTGNPTMTIKRDVDTLLSSALEAGIISKRIHDFLITPFPLTPLFYVLPKIHKSLVNPPGRPIVAGTGSVFQSLAVFLDQVLRPRVSGMRSFLLDTTDFLSKISGFGTFNSPIFLCTMDVAQKIVRKHWHILGSDPTLPTAFREQPVCAFKRSNNLRDALVHARSTIPPAERGFHLINHLDTAIGH